MLGKTSSLFITNIQWFMQLPYDIVRIITLFITVLHIFYFTPRLTQISTNIFSKLIPLNLI
jgi:hypothetical protein